MRQVFANLIGNVSDAMKAGCVLRLKVRDGRNHRTGEEGVRVTIADTGSGMNENTRQHLFDPFFTTKGINGSGLGPGVSADILQRHRGAVQVKSKQTAGACGTIFYIFFPLHAINPDQSVALPTLADVDRLYSSAN